MSNVIQFKPRQNCSEATNGEGDKGESISDSIAQLTTAIKRMHGLMRVAPDEGGIDLLIRWQALRDDLERLDLQSPTAREELEVARAELNSSFADLTVWREKILSRNVSA